MRIRPLLCILATAALTASAGEPPKPDPAKKPAGQDDGFVTLFDGKDLSAFEPDGNWAVEDGGVLARKGGGSGCLWTRERYGDFVLDLEFKTARNTISGVHLRSTDARNWYSGLEVKLVDSSGKDKPGTHDCGAIYDCLAPSKNAVKKSGEWNRMVITCRANKVGVVLNDEPVIDMDLDLWTTARKNPDGTANKFPQAQKDRPRKGFIGFQNHGLPIWCRNIRIKALAEQEQKEKSSCATSP